MCYRLRPPPSLLSDLWRLLLLQCLILLPPWLRSRQPFPSLRWLPSFLPP